MIYLGKLKIKTPSGWEEIKNLDELTVNTKLQTNVTPSSDNDVVNKNYLDLKIQEINKVVAESGGVFIANGTEDYNPPVENQAKLWIDTNPKTGGLKYYNGSAWVYVPVAFS